jgi:hypothetical protein
MSKAGDRDGASRRLTPDTLIARAEIEDAFNRYVRALNFSEWHLLDGLFTDDADLDYTATGGNRCNGVTLKNWLSEAFSAFAAVQVIVTNILCDFSEDETSADVYAAYQDVLVLPGASEGDTTTMFVGGWYDDTWRRTEVGWQVVRRRTKPGWAAGDQPPAD